MTKTTNWKDIEQISSVSTTTTGRIIGTASREESARARAEGDFDGNTFEPDKLSTDERIKFISNLTTFTCGHAVLYWKPCRRCHRDNESAKHWWKRLRPKLVELLRQVR